MTSLGWIEDHHDPRDYNFRERIGIGAPAGASQSLLQFREGRLEQDGVSACVGFALARAIHVCLLAEGLTTAPVPSPLFLYFNGRAQEYAGMTPEEAPPVEDLGSRPRLVMQAARALGFCKESSWPFSYEHRNTRPKTSCYASAYDQQNLEFYRISSTGSDRIDEVRLAFAKNIPVIFGTQVDEAFKEHRSSEPIESMAESIGRHMLCALADDGAILFDNWWGKNWGFGDGFGRMSYELFGSGIIGDIYAVKAAPLYTT